MKVEDGTRPDVHTFYILVPCSKSESTYEFRLSTSRY